VIESWNALRCLSQFGLDVKEHLLEATVIGKDTESWTSYDTRAHQSFLHENSDLLRSSYHSRLLAGRAFTRALELRTRKNFSLGFTVGISCIGISKGNHIDNQVTGENGFLTLWVGQCYYLYGDVCY